MLQSITRALGKMGKNKLKGLKRAAYTALLAATLGSQTLQAETYVHSPYGPLQSHGLIATSDNPIDGGYPEYQPNPVNEAVATNRRQATALKKIMASQPVPTTVNWRGFENAIRGTHNPDLAVRTESYNQLFGVLSALPNEAAMKSGLATYLERCIAITGHEFKEIQGAWEYERPTYNVVDQEFRNKLLSGRGATAESSMYGTYSVGYGGYLNWRVSSMDEQFRLAASDLAIVDVCQKALNPTARELELSSEAVAQIRQYVNHPQFKKQGGPIGPEQKLIVALEASLLIQRHLDPNDHTEAEKVANAKGVLQTLHDSAQMNLVCRGKAWKDLGVRRAGAPAEIVSEVLKYYKAHKSILEKTSVPGAPSPTTDLLGTQGIQSPVSVRTYPGTPSQEGPQQP